MSNPNLVAGPGRPKGLPNKATLKAREAIAAFVDGNAHRLTEWLDAIALKDPKQAFDCFQSVIEYHIPKLARSEVTGADGKDLIPTEIALSFHKPVEMLTVIDNEA